MTLNFHFKSIWKGKKPGNFKIFLKKKKKKNKEEGDCHTRYQHLFKNSRSEEGYLVYLEFRGKQNIWDLERTGL